MSYRKLDSFQVDSVESLDAWDMYKLWKYLHELN
ncbi:hypothetical protein RZF15_05536 [Klebsiella pneumoniae]|nr:Uncharacterised protein [Klebsiella pneumoniae]